MNSFTRAFFKGFRFSLPNSISVLLSIFCILAFSLSGNQYLRPQLAYASNTSPQEFGLGISAFQEDFDGWIKDTEVPWTYAYQYLVGGVNTPNSWKNWHPQAMFPLNYAHAANKSGQVPVFTFYNVLNSQGTCDQCSESHRDISNLNNQEIMRQYYLDFKLLMQRLGQQNIDGVQGFGKTAIVHVEPDLSGFAQQATLFPEKCFGYCTSQGNDANILPTRVSDTGLEELSDLPNTFAGFNLALARIRNQYAPNVKLAYHASTWATGADLASSKDPNLDPTTIGQKTIEFVNQSTVLGSPQGYDFVFTDVADRDAGYYKYVLGDDSKWWDRHNQTFPNFRRWETFIKAISQTSEKPVIVWQIPEGNQYFQTMNNTRGHYQDNRAEYFFEHIQTLKEVGIVGLLFGAGNDGSTFHTNRNNNAVTNHDPICTQDGSSQGPICNTNLSTLSDDDGGYIRMKAKEFYTSTLPNPTPKPLEQQYVISTWWPVQEATVAGLQPFLARIDNLNLNDYSLFWSVDGGQLNSMYDSYEGGPHKQAFVDVSSWTWKTERTFEITFTAKNNQQQVIASTTVMIIVV